MAAGRERRANAGAKMSRLIDDEEDEDDFYKSTYGGFSEEKDDQDYESEASVSDAADSDFSNDEDDALRSDIEDEDETKPKRKSGVSTKSYKEPVKKQPKPKSENKEKDKEKDKKKKLDRSAIQIYNSSMERKSLRRSTAQKSALTEEREKQREEKVKMMKAIAAKKNVPEVRRLTQEELLEEARETEIENLKSLDAYQRMESEKKKNRVQKIVNRGPVIRYQSVTMPLLEELPDFDMINVDEDGEGETNRYMSKSSEHCSRTFITFTDEKIFRDHFPHKREKPRPKHNCVVTGLPAKYIDPITKLPYANAQAFKIIRDAYQKQILEQEKKGDR